jgi:hypothetical protein
VARAAHILALACFVAGLPTLAEARSRATRVRSEAYAKVGYWDIAARYRGSRFHDCLMSHDLGFPKTADLGEGVKAPAFTLAKGVLALRASVPWHLEPGKHPYQIAVGAHSWDGSFELSDSEINDYAEVHLDLPQDPTLLQQMRRAAYLDVRATPDLPTVRVRLDNFSRAHDRLQKCDREKSV